MNVYHHFLRNQGNRNFYTLYIAHNLHFIVYACMFDGQYQLALDSARKLSTILTEDTLNATCLGPFCGIARYYNTITHYLKEGLSALHYHVYVRFGKWKEILEEPKPENPEVFKFSSVLHPYARALAFAVLNKIEEAENEEKEFDRLVAELPEDWRIFNNTCKDISAVAKQMMRGEIEYRKGNFDEAFARLRESVFLGDNLIYDEPWSWMQPPRHALGALLLEQGRVEEAEKVYQDDLQVHPNNFWALHGLSECLELQGKDSSSTKSECEKAKLRFDVPANASCYCRLSVQ